MASFHGIFRALSTSTAAFRNDFDNSCAMCFLKFTVKRPTRGLLFLIRSPPTLDSFSSIGNGILTFGSKQSSEDDTYLLSHDIRIFSLSPIVRLFVDISIIIISDGPGFHRSSNNVWFEAAMYPFSCVVSQTTSERRSHKNLFFCHGTAHRGWRQCRGEFSSVSISSTNKPTAIDILLVVFGESSSWSRDYATPWIRRHEQMRKDEWRSYCGTLKELSILRTRFLAWDPTAYAKSNFPLICEPERAWWTFYRVNREGSIRVGKIDTEDTLLSWLFVENCTERKWRAAR